MTAAATAVGLALLGAGLLQTEMSAKPPEMKHERPLGHYQQPPEYFRNGVGQPHVSPWQRAQVNASKHIEPGLYDIKNIAPMNHHGFSRDLNGVLITPAKQVQGMQSVALQPGAGAAKLPKRRRAAPKSR